MKPTATFRNTGPTTARHSVAKNGHQAVDVYCRRGSEEVATKLGRYGRARFDDGRANVVPAQPECREYTPANTWRPMNRWARCPHRAASVDGAPSWLAAD